ncbi:MAG: RAMP superfamily CRISPR-associated protein [Bacteroidia bacterium]|nr:RAMP superfamily CRISPR-associated protein [Bacteroidia bacterium]
MANNNRYQDRVIGKVILWATLSNESPLLIGRGGGDAVDIEVMRLPDGKPYIPASSIAGCLRSFSSGQDGYFWGETGRNNKTGKSEQHPLQSHIRFDDLIPEASYKPEDIVMRDGVKIDHKKGTAEDKKKYDYQVIEPGISFPFRAEITLRASRKDDWKTFVESIKESLQSPHFRIGANTNTGFGKVTCTGFQVFHFQFPAHADAWFEYLEKGTLSIPEMPIKVDPQQLGKGSFSIEATFRLKSSLMIGAYGIKGDEPDKSQLKSRDRHVLPGKSIRGAIRHRAVRIWKIMGKDEAALFDLFGHVSEDEKTQIRSRLRVEEFRFQKDEVEPMVQNRIRIDRFTGGVIDGALFNSAPVWTTGQEQIKLTFTILKGATPDEKKLLLLLLKDLWLEDLAIGGEKNVGRGILTGLNAEVWNDGQKVAAFKRKGQGPELEFLEGSVANLNVLVNPQPVTP